MEKIKFLILKFRVPIVLFLIMLFAFFLRLYGLKELLHFELDQARDAFLIREVLEKGAGEIPLLGPRAGGSMLHLGPFFYYLMLIPAFILRSSDPALLALPEIFFGLLLVPVVYSVFQRVFDFKDKNRNRWPLAMTLLVGTSAFLVAYDRFSWNPNLLPFFSAALILLFIKYLETKRKDGQKTVFGLVFAIGMILSLIFQLHFIAMLALPPILGLTLTVFFWRQKKIFKQALNLKLLAKEIAVVLLAIVIFQAPVWINEIISSGANSQEFLQTIAERQDKDELHSTAEKLIQNLGVYPKGFFVGLTGFSGVDYPILLLRPKLDILCDQACRNGLFFSIFALIIFLILFSFVGKKLWSLKTKINAGNVHFELLLLCLIWVLIAWWSLYSQSFNLKPRFFLFSIIPFWILLAFGLRELIKFRQKGYLVGAAVVFLLLGLNQTANFSRWQTFAGASAVELDGYARDDIFPLSDSYPVTIQQQKDIARWMAVKYKQSENLNEKSLLFFWAPPFYYRSINYFLEETEFRDETNYFSNYPVWLEGKYFAVTRTSKPENFFKDKRVDNFEVKDYQIFGTLTAYELKLTEKGLEEAKGREKKFLANKRLTNPEKIKKQCLKNPKASCRFNWGDVF